MTEMAVNTPGNSPYGEDMRQFLEEIRAFPRLSVDEERTLARRCAQGDEEAIRHMVNANLRLVVSIARDYAGRGSPMLDLIQEGSIGLLAAARNFDHTRNLRFSTYATKSIRRRMVRFLIAHSGPIQVPEHTAESIHRIRAAASLLRQETGQEPTVRLLAEETGLSPEKVEELMLLDPEVCSLDILVGCEDGSTLANLIQDEQTPEPHSELVRRELEQTMERLLDTLEPRERMILRLHFGMEDGQCHSFEKIGKQMEISKERARQICQRAMEKLGKTGADMGLEDFLE